MVDSSDEEEEDADEGHRREADEDARGNKNPHNRKISKELITVVRRTFGNKNKSVK